MLVLTLMLARCPGWSCQWLFLCRGRAIANFSGSPRGMRAASMDS